MMRSLVPLVLLLIFAACKSGAPDADGAASAAPALGEQGGAAVGEHAAVGTNGQAAAAPVEAAPTPAAAPAIAEGAGGAVVDHSRPDAVVQAIFSAACDGALEMLAGLCDPLGENDRDTQRICDVDAATKDEFLAHFASGRLAGPAIVAADGNSAEVSVLIGPAGDDPETLNLVRRETGWYLSSF